MWKFRERHGFIGFAPVLLLLAGCGGADPDCNSEDTRASVVKAISGDSNNPLVDYAVKNSDALKKKLDAASSDADKAAISAKARQTAVYRLDDSVTTNSKSMDKKTLTCSGKMIATVEGDIVQKQVDFKVQQGSDGQTSVSVQPFQFDPSANPAEH
jgi:hypothetical protein